MTPAGQKEQNLAVLIEELEEQFGVDKALIAGQEALRAL